MALEGVPAGDIAVFAVFELFSLPFAFDGTERLRAGEPWSKVILSWFIALALILLGILFPWARKKLGKQISGWLDRLVRNRAFWITGYILAVVLLVGLAVGIYHHYHKSNSEPASAQSPSGTGTPQSEAHTVRVVDEGDSPIRGAEIYFIRRNGVHSSKAVSDNAGIAEVAILKEVVSVFCALDGFSSYYQKDYNPSTPLKIRLKKSPRGGSVIFADGTGYITGLSGRLNPILDSEARTYLYAENIAINAGKTQPVVFVLNVPLTLEDIDGHRFEITIISIIGSSSLIDYRRLV